MENPAGQDLREFQIIYVVKDLAKWSRKWPKHKAYSQSATDQMNDELYRIEETAKQLFPE